MLWKDTIIRFSSKSELLFFLILPVTFTALLGGFMSPDPDADNRIPLLVVNEDGSALAERLIDTLAQSDSVHADEMAMQKRKQLLTTKMPRHCW